MTRKISESQDKATINSYLLAHLIMYLIDSVIRFVLDWIEFEREE